MLPAGSQWAGLPDSPLLSPCPLSSITELRARRVHPITQKAAVSRPGPPCKPNYVQIPHPLGDMQVGPSLMRQRWAPRNLGRAGSRLLPTVPRPQLSSPGVRSSPYTSALAFLLEEICLLPKRAPSSSPPRPPPLPGPGPHVHPPSQSDGVGRRQQVWVGIVAPACTVPGWTGDFIFLLSSVSPHIKQSPSHLRHGQLPGLLELIYGSRAWGRALSPCSTNGSFFCEGKEGE